MRTEHRKLKCAMKSNRKSSRLHQALKSSTKLVECKDALLDETLNKMHMYKNMARSYWERWRWETQKLRKESDVREFNQNFLLEIDPSVLNNVSEEGITYVIWYRQLWHWQATVIL